MAEAESDISVVASTKYHVSTRGIEYDVVAQTPQMAIRDFFRRIMTGKISLDQLGIVGNVTWDDVPKGYSIPFRIPPSLFNMGYLEWDGYKTVISANFPEITDDMLIEIAQKDAWMTEVITKS